MKNERYSHGCLIILSLSKNVYKKVAVETTKLMEIKIVKCFAATNALQAKSPTIIAYIP